MAKKKETKKELKEVSRKEINGATIITYEDGSVKIIPAPIVLSAEEAADLFGSEDADDEDEEEEEDDDDDSDDEEDEDSDEDDEDEDEDDGVTPEDLAGMDFEALEDLCDDKELETDPDEFDEEDVEKLRKAVAKELGITLPKAKAASSKDTKKKKK